MTDALSEFLALKKETEQLTQRKARLEGAEQEHLKTLKEDFGTADLKEAKKLLAKLEKEAAEAEREFKRELKAYQEKWK